MNTKDLHGGHRERIMQKFLNYPDSFNDHELLELLLFFSIPRKDTNPVAHNLLNTFGNVSEVFSASAEELMAVDGIGEKSAAFIVLLGKLLERAEERKKQKSTKKMFSFERNKYDAIEFFRGLNTEQMFISLLDEKFTEITKLVYGQENQEAASALISDIAKAFAIKKPHYVIIAHNHPSGSLTPSKADDETTAQLNLLCAVHGVSLVDHYIVAGDSIYSYHTSGRLKYIKNNYNLQDILSNAKDIGKEFEDKEI